MKDTHGSQDWRALCELASREQDPEKLLDLVSKINQALEEWNRQSQIDRTPIRIKNVLLSADRVDDPRLEMPGLDLPAMTSLEYDG